VDGTGSWSCPMLGFDISTAKLLGSVTRELVRLERILTMVYVVQYSQNFSGLFPSSCIPKNTTFRKLDLFPSSGDGGGEDTYSVGPLRERQSQSLGQ
jgi:hypothetical protein